MCYRPIKILNNCRTYQHGVNPLYNYVPCGKCPECQGKIQNDWLVRLYYEYKHSVKTIFATFTYNDDYLPRLSLTGVELSTLHNFLDYIVSDSYEDKFSKLNRSLYRDSYTLSVADGLDVLTAYRNKLHEYLGDRLHDFEVTHGVPANLYVPSQVVSFSRSDLQNMMKKLRQILHQRGILDYSGNPIKAFTVCEYGSKNKRPHYHTLFFLPVDIDKDLFLELLELSWSKSVKVSDVPLSIKKCADLMPLNSERVFSTHKDWNDWKVRKNRFGRCYFTRKFGSVRYSDKNPPVITSPAGVQYVTKYVGKKDSYLYSDDFNKLRSFCSLFPATSVLREMGFNGVADVLKKLRCVFPFVKASNGLGLSLLDELYLLPDSDKMKYMNEPSIAIDGNTQLFQVPQYIINRIMYSPCDFDNTLRKLTPIGVEVLKKRFDVRLCEMDSKLAFTFSTPSLSVLGSDAWKYIKETFNLSKSQFEDFIKQFVFDRSSFRDVALYSLVYRNVTTTLDNIDTFTIEQAYDNSHSIFEQRLVHTYDGSVSPIWKSRQAVAVCNRYCYNNAPCFAGFDLLLDLYTYISAQYRLYQSMERRKKYVENLETKNLYNEFYYENYY